MHRDPIGRLAFALLVALSADAFSQAPQKPMSREDMQALMPNSHIETREELLQLMPGAHLTITLGDASKAEWTNGAEGRLDAVRWGSPPTAAIAAHVVGSGSWRISDDGRYCGRAGWKAYGSPVTVDWCRFLVKTEDGGYILKSVTNAPDWVLQIAK